MSVPITLEKSSAKSKEIRLKGNQVFRRKNRDDYREVLSLYTKSIAYAPLNSEELASAYYNRSSLWLHLKKYDLCLVDIDHALSITKSNDLVQKILSRKEKCLDYVKPPVKVAQRKTKLPQVTPSTLIPCAADCIELKWDEEYGRHYTATRDIGPGEFIMIEQTCYASVDAEQMYLICNHCLAFAWAGISCDSCVLAIYCSESCKSKAWSQYHDVVHILFSDESFSDYMMQYIHKRETQSPLTLDDLASSVLMIFVRMMIIVIRSEGLENVVKVTQEIVEGKNDISKNLTLFQKPNCADLRFISSLTVSEKNSDEIVSHLVPLILSASRLSRNISHEKVEDVVLSSLKIMSDRLYKIVMANSFKCSTNDCVCMDSQVKDCTSTRGEVFGPYSSFFNHSCIYNTDRIFVPGPRILFFTTRPVSKGEQLFITYGPITNTTKKLRQSALQAHHSFTCRCIPCKEDWPADYAKYERTDEDEEELARKHVELFGKTGRRFFGIPISFDPIFYSGSLKMIDFIYKRFKTQKKASACASFYKRYVRRYIYNTYGDVVDLHHINSFHLAVQHYLQKSGAI
ncbi:hypothetical protein QAD02_015605 [Eretmocerus hayati]|uniref:Uncharacterized protein n=1 Tax=Eretmocerus hayati TaxID=131215 RepID=A0ACC2P9Q2_9HYME|nr:hypothetical protein QAD02_015605 [Eretmocerus hayati]